MASRWILWVWLEYIGVVNGCCCKEVHRFPHNIIYPYSTCISFFFAASIPTSLFIFKSFSFLFMLFLCNIANIAQTTFEIVQKSSHVNMAIQLYRQKCMSTACVNLETSTCEVPHDISRKLQLTLCVIMVS